MSIIGIQNYNIIHRSHPDTEPKIYIIGEKHRFAECQLLNSQLLEREATAGSLCFFEGVKAGEELSPTEVPLYTSSYGLSEKALKHISTYSGWDTYSSLHVDIHQLYSTINATVGHDLYIMQLTLSRILAEYQLTIINQNDKIPANKRLQQLANSWKTLVHEIETIHLSFHTKYLPLLNEWENQCAHLLPIPLLQPFPPGLIEALSEMTTEIEASVEKAKSWEKGLIELTKLETQITIIRQRKEVAPEDLAICKEVEKMFHTIRRGPQAIEPITVDELQIAILDLLSKHRNNIKATTDIMKTAEEALREETKQQFPARTQSMCDTLQKVHALFENGQISGKVFFIAGSEHIREQSTDPRLSLDPLYRTLKGFQIPVIVLYPKVIDQ